ncbi:hypothetical protein TWF173_000210 [Orbilia oligospora]|nr:hypothetical protein TWF173_000210 [Orbilia oligospora]
MKPLLRPRFGMLSHRFEAFAIYAPLLRWERAAWRVLREYNDVPSMKPERPPETIGEVPEKKSSREFGIIHVLTDKLAHEASWEGRWLMSSWHVVPDPEDREGPSTSSAWRGAAKNDLLAPPMGLLKFA